MGMNSRRPRTQMMLLLEGQSGEEHNCVLSDDNKSYLFTAGGMDNFVVFTSVDFGKIACASLYLTGPHLDRLSET